MLTPIFVGNSEVEFVTFTTEPSPTVDAPRNDYATLTNENCEAGNSAAQCISFLRVVFLHCCSGGT